MNASNTSTNSISRTLFASGQVHAIAVSRSWFRDLFKLVCIIAGVALTARVAPAQDMKYWGNYQSGSHGIADESVRFYAFSYVGDFADRKAIWDHAWQAVRELNAKDETHEYKDGNGNFNELRIGQDRVFVIGWWNPKARRGVGEGAFMATVPGSSGIYTSDRGTLVNDGWQRQTWMSNGHKINLQLGCYRGMVQWSLGHEQ